MNWFKRRTTADATLTSDMPAPRKTGHGAMYYFALFSRILTPLAILGWLCWMPSPDRTLPKNWDPGCPELKGTWIECELDANKQDLVSARLFYLDAARLLQIEHVLKLGQGSNAATESRIALLDPASGSRIQQTSWMPGQAHYWPGIGLATSYHDAAAHTFRLAHWDLDTLIESKVLTLPDNHWSLKLGNYGMDGYQFKPAPNSEWRVLGPNQRTRNRVMVRGLELDANGDFKSIGWESDPDLEIYTTWDPVESPSLFPSAGATGASTFFQNILSPAGRMTAASRRPPSRSTGLAHRDSDTPQSDSMSPLSRGKRTTAGSGLNRS